jgi:hypothetical protein
MYLSILFWKHRFHNVFGHCRKSIEFNPSWIKRILYAMNMFNILWKIYKTLAFPTACMPDAMDTVSEVANANVSQRDRENLEAR